MNLQGPTMSDITNLTLKVVKLQERQQVIKVQIAELEDRYQIIQHEITEIQRGAS